MSSLEPIPFPFCLPSSEALQGQIQRNNVIPIPKPSPYEIENGNFFLPPVKQPLTQPVSPVYNHRSPSPKRYKLPIYISIDNYNLRKKQEFTDKYTIEAISILQIDPNLLFIDQQQPLEPQLQRISILQNEIRQLRYKLKSQNDGRSTVTCLPSLYSNKNHMIPAKTLPNNSKYKRPFNYQSRLECVKERNKQREKRAEEIALRNQEEAHRMQELIIKTNQETKKRLIDIELTKRKRAVTHLQKIEMNIVPIVF